MKVLLCDDVEKLGYLGDIVEVKTGYARNYLIPQGIAIVPTESAVKSLEKEKAKRAELRKMARIQLEKAAEKVEGAVVSLTAKANQQGHLFGSVAQRDIAENLRSQGYEVADDMIIMDSHIKETGIYDIKVKFAADLSKNISVKVEAQGEEIESQASQND